MMLGNAPIGELLWSGFPNLKLWILAVPNNAARRGIVLGMFIGTVGVALRIFTGRERGYLGRVEQ